MQCLWCGKDDVGSIIFIGAELSYCSEHAAQHFYFRDELIRCVPWCAVPAGWEDALRRALRRRKEWLFFKEVSDAVPLVP